MKALTRNWKAVLALLLVIAALCVWMFVYRPAKAEYEQQQATLANEMMLLQMQIASQQANNEQVISLYKKYEPLIDKLPGETLKLQNSRRSLYRKFPAEMREEDQLMYVVYLENLLKEWEPELENDLRFNFAEFEVGKTLSDASFGGVTLNIPFTARYETLKRLVDYLSSDERIASVRYATLNYIEEGDYMKGTLGVCMYMLRPNDYNSKTDYTEPETGWEGERGKDNIFTSPNPDKKINRKTIPGIA